MPGPPPPPPPPPSAGAPPPKATGERKDLLSSIEGFKKGKLKKAETNDRSAPFPFVFFPFYFFKIKFLEKKKKKNQSLKEAVAVLAGEEACLLEECQNFHQKQHSPQLAPVQLPQVEVALPLQDQLLEAVASIHLLEVNIQI